MLNLRMQLDRIIKEHRKNANLVVISKAGFNKHEKDIVIQGYQFSSLNN